MPEAAPPSPVATPHIDKRAMLRLVLASSQADGLMLALGEMVASNDATGTQDERDAADRSILDAAEGLSATLAQFPDLEDFDLAFVRVPREERLRISAVKAAGSAVVGIVAGLDVEHVTIFPESPSSEVAWGGVVRDLTDGVTTTEERFAEVRAVARSLIAALVAPGWATMIVLGVTARATGADMNRAAAYARLFFPSDDGEAFADGHHAASVVLQHANSAVRKVADLLLAHTSLPGRVIAGIVADNLGHKLLALRSGLFPPGRP